MSDQNNQKGDLLSDIHLDFDEEQKEIERLKKLRQLSENREIPESVYGLSQEIVASIDALTKQKLWQEAATEARINAPFRRPKFEDDVAVSELNEITALLEEKFAANPNIKINGEREKQILHSNCEDMVFALYDTIQRDPGLLTSEAISEVRNFVSKQNNIDSLAAKHASDIVTKHDLVGGFLADANKAIATQRLGRDFEIQRAFGSRGQADIEIANSFEKEITKELNENQKQEIHFRNNVLKEFYYQQNIKEISAAKTKEQKNTGQIQVAEEKKPLIAQASEKTSQKPVQSGKARSGFLKFLEKIFSPILKLFGFGSSKNSKQSDVKARAKMKEDKTTTAKISAQKSKPLTKEEQNRKLFGDLLRNSISPDLKADSVDAVMTARLIEATAAILEARNPSKYSSFSNANDEALDLVVKYTSDTQISNFLNEHAEQSNQKNRSSNLELEQKGTVMALEILAKDILPKASTKEIDQNAKSGSDLDQRHNELSNEIARLEQSAKISTTEAGFWDKFSDQIKGFVSTQDKEQLKPAGHEAGESIQRIIAEHNHPHAQSKSEDEAR